MTIDDGRIGPGGRAPRGAFSASDAAFTGLQMLTREPRTWLIWSGLFLVFSLVIGVVMVVTAGPALMELTSTSAASRPDPAAAMALFGRLAPFYAVTTVGSVVFYAVAFAAVNRAVLRPLPAGFAHLALGGDELRQFIVLVLLGLVLMAVYIVCLVAAVVIGVAVGLATAHGAPAAPAGGPVALIFLLLGVLVVGTVLFVMTRLSLASPIAFDTGRIDLGASWRMTRGRFWALFGAYVLASLIGAVFFIIVGVAMALLAFTVSGGLTGLTALMRPNMSSLSGYFGPLQLVWMLVNAALSPLIFALTLGAPAGAYAQLRVDGAAVAAAPPAPGADLPRFGR